MHTAQVKLWIWCLHLRVTEADVMINNMDTQHCSFIALFCFVCRAYACLPRQQRSFYNADPMIRQYASRYLYLMVTWAILWYFGGDWVDDMVTVMGFSLWNDKPATLINTPVSFAHCFLFIVSFTINSINLLSVTHSNFITHVLQRNLNAAFTWIQRIVLIRLWTFQTEILNIK